MPPAEPIIALDARLVGKASTGDSTYWTGLLHGLGRIEHGFKFLLFSNDDRPPGIPESPHFEWAKLGSTSSRWWSAAAFPLAARRRGASVIHTQYNLSPIAGRRSVTTVHDVSFLIGPGWFRPLDRAILTRFVPASIRRAAKVITVSETSKSDIERLIPAARGKTVATLLALNPDITPMPRAQAQEHVRGRLGLEGPYLLAVGTRWPRKNMRLAIDAAELLRGGLPHRLLVTGKPGWGETGHGNRTLATGYVPNETLSALYAAADLYLAPSLYEGFGLPLLEAFACGCPVLCSTGGALPEVAGNAAEVLNDWTPRGWAGAIENLLDDSSKLLALREAGLERVKSFRWEDTAEQTCGVYREVLG